MRSSEVRISSPSSETASALMANTTLFNPASRSRCSSSTRVATNLIPPDQPPGTPPEERTPTATTFPHLLDGRNARSPGDEVAFPQVAVCWAVLIDVRLVPGHDVACLRAGRETRPLLWYVLATPVPKLILNGNDIDVTELNGVWAL